MKINGIEGMSADDIRHEIQRGGSFVIYQYCISVVVMTFRRSSGVCFIRGGHSRISHGLPFTLISLFLGWWGIPWGPIWTIQSFVTNFGGGKDITQAVVSSLRGPAPAPAAPQIPQP